MQRCEVWRRWRLNHDKGTVEERLYVKAADGLIWRSEWRRTGIAFYMLWRSARWDTVATVEPDAKLIGRYKLPARGEDSRAALVLPK